MLASKPLLLYIKIDTTNKLRVAGLTIAVELYLTILHSGKSSNALSPNYSLQMQYIYIYFFCWFNNFLQ